MHAKLREPERRLVPNDEAAAYVIKALDFSAKRAEALLHHPPADVRPSTAPCLLWFFV